MNTPSTPTATAARARYSTISLCPPNMLFFQAEDGIRYGTVTGVQTCALPIWDCLIFFWYGVAVPCDSSICACAEIGRASCRERGEISVVAVSLKNIIIIY